MINRVILVGRITKDIELRKTPNGASVVSFTVACNRRSKAEGQPDADFINCVAWNRQADLMAQYLHKGSLIGVEGRIQTRNYEDRDGKRVYVTEVVAESVQFLEPKNAGQSRSYDNSQNVSSSYNNNYNNNYNSQGQVNNAYANNNYANNNAGNNSYGYGQQPSNSNDNRSFEEQYSGDTLDIASDDLPF